MNLLSFINKIPNNINTRFLLNNKTVKLYIDEYKNYKIKSLTIELEKK